MLEPPGGGGCVSTGCKLCEAAERGGEEDVTNSSQKWIFCREITLALGLQIQEPGLFIVRTLSVSQSFRNALISS